MPKENIENLLTRPDKEYRAVEAHEATQNRFADQEMQVGMAGPYTVKTIRPHSLASTRVESPRQSGERGIHGEERCSKRPKELISPGRRSTPMPRIE